MLNALTIDVEDYFHVQAFADVISSAHWDEYPVRVERNTFRLLEILGRRNVKATFFILGWVADHCPALVRAIVDSGHEIGSHGYGHRMLTRGSQASFRRSEEHTSELQSHVNLVCRLLLEKKK